MKFKIKHYRKFIAWLDQLVESYSPQIEELEETGTQTDLCKELRIQREAALVIHKQVDEMLTHLELPPGPAQFVGACNKHDRPDIPNIKNKLTDSKKIQQALKLAIRFGGIDGDHHKAWVIDQMVRRLTGKDYDKVVADAKAGEDGPDSYDWDVGIAP